VSITNGGDNVDSPRNLIDEGSSQSGDRSYGQVGGRITNLGADANRVLAILKTQIDKDAQFRKLWTNALAKLGDKLNELGLRQQDTEELLRVVRGEISKGDSTVLNMTDARLNAHKAEVAERMIGQSALTDRRLTDLEQGTLAAILLRMEADTKERRERQALNDLTWRVVIWGMVFLFLMNVSVVILVVLEVL
jgi:hypothetical protein